MNAARHAALALLRDWRSGELTVMALAVVIAVTAVSSVGFAADRMRRAMDRQATSLLAADLVLSAGSPLPAEYRATAGQRGLNVSETISFRSMVVVGERMQLAEVKAVDAAYPLRGEMEISDSPFGLARVAAHGPAAGIAWGDSRLLQTLAIKPGDSLKLGALTLTQGPILTLEPDRGGDLFNIAPRLLISMVDLPGTGLIQPGSRATYRLLLSGSAAEIEAYRRWAKQRAGNTLTFQGVRDGRPEVREAMQKAERFLGLASVVAVLLASAAIAIAARRFAARHLDHGALLRCFGAQRGFMLQIFIFIIIYLALILGLVGSLCGLLASEALVTMSGKLLAQRPPPPSLSPVLLGLLTAFTSLIGFALPPMSRVTLVPPARVLRRDLGPPPLSAALSYGAATAAIALLAYWQTRDLKLTAYTVGGSALTLLVLAGVALLVMRLLGSLRGRVGVSWRYGLANISRRRGESVVQVSVLGLAILVLLLLTLVRGDLLAAWRERLPPNTPNQFLVNIQPDETDAVKQFLAERTGAKHEVYPMVRARLIKINHRDVHEEDFTDIRGRSFAARDFNLSWAAALPAENRVLSGRWWPASGPLESQWSLELDIAHHLQLKLGDHLTYQVADQIVAGKITSLRKVNWDSFRVNFFVIGPPGFLEEFPKTFVTSFYLPATQRHMLNDLLERFPSVTVVDVAAIMDQVRLLIDRVARAVEYLSLFTLAAGIVVVLAAVRASQDERRREAALLRALGASEATVISGLLAEFLSLGLIAGTVAAIGASATAYVLARYAFEIEYHFNLAVCIWGPLAGAAIVGTAGLLGTRSVIQTPPMAALRRA